MLSINQLKKRYRKRIYEMPYTVKPLLVVSWALITLASLTSPVSAQTHSPTHKADSGVPRIISAGAGVTELILALDAGNELVGVDSTSHLPEQFSDVKQLGYHRMLSAEGILALSPNLLIGSEVMGPETTLALLSKANIRVVKLPQANDETQLMANIDQLGQLLNKQENANRLKQQLHQQLSKIASKQRQLSAIKPKVVFMLLQEGRGARVGGRGTAADTIIELAGAENGADFDGYKTLSQEGVLVLQPELILLSSRSDSNSPQSADLLKQMPLLAHTPAGKALHFHNLSPQSLIGGLGISAIAAADELATQLIEQPSTKPQTHAE